MKWNGLKQWSSILAVAIVTLAVACNSYDKDLIQLSDSIMALPEPATFVTDFDKNWEQAREKHAPFRAELETLFTSEQLPTLETIEAEIAKTKEIIELDLEYIKGAKALYLGQIATKERVAKVALHVELMRNVLLRLVFAYSISATPVKESKNLDDRFMIENKINGLVAAAKPFLDRVTVALNTLGFSPDFALSTRTSVMKALLEDLKKVGISLDGAQIAIAAQVKSRTESRPPSADGFIDCTTFSEGLEFRHSSRDSSFSTDKVVGQCIQHNRTVDEMCKANLMCSDGKEYKVYTSCKTFSNGYEFSTSSREINVAKSVVTERCISNRKTDDAECKANISCDDGSKYPEYVTCTTSSKGLSFSRQTRSKALTMEKVVAVCVSHRLTEDRECSVNLKCEGPSRSVVGD